MSLLNKLKSRLSKTRHGVVEKIQQTLARSPVISEDLIDEIEEHLILSDIGIDTSTALITGVRRRIQAEKISDSGQIRDVLKHEMTALLLGDQPAPNGSDFFHTEYRPFVIMVVGVNGSGKTTSIGKLAARFTALDRSVLIAAADTFRAAAAEQLDIWAQRSGSQIVRQQPGADPAAVAFDAVSAAIARDVEVVIVDTAGRLHTKVSLMEELKKVGRAIGKQVPDAPHETLLVVDATTGQNAKRQVEEFSKAMNLSGIILTKLDGTAKGGVIIGIADEFGVPVRFIGIGEQIDDLEPFNAELFIEALFAP